MAQHNLPNRDNSPWCPTCVGRKGHTLVCDGCYAKLPDDLKDATIRAKESLWTLEARALLFLEQRPDRYERTITEYTEKK